MAIPASTRSLSAAQVLASGSQQRRSPSSAVPIAEGDLAFLRGLARAFAHGTAPPDAAADLEVLAAGISSWEAIELLLQMHRCAGIAYRVLTQPEVQRACRLPVETMDWLRSWYIDAFTRLVAEPPIVQTCLTALTDASVPALVIKGLAVGAWLYDDPALREHLDVDLAVSEDQADAVHAVLSNLGYERVSGPFDHPHPFDGPPLSPGESLATISYFNRRRRMSIDLSFDPMRVFWRPDPSMPDPFRGWWERRQIVTIGAVQLPTLGPEDQFLQLSRHLQFHDFFRVTWFIDVLLLLRRHGDRLDWSYVGRQASAFGIRGGLYRTLELADRVYGVVAPDQAWRSLRPSVPVRVLNRRVWPDARAMPRDRRVHAGNPLSPRMLGLGGTRQILGLLLLVFDRHRRRNIAHLVRRALPPRDWLQAVYGTELPSDASYLRLWRYHRREVAALWRSTDSTLAPPPEK